MRDKKKELRALLGEGVEEFMSLATKAMLVLRGLELLGAKRETTAKMWLTTYKELYGDISKFSLEDIAMLLSEKGDEKNE